MGRSSSGELVTVLKFLGRFFNNRDCICLEADPFFQPLIRPACIYAPGNAPLSSQANLSIYFSTSEPAPVFLKWGYSRDEVLGWNCLFLQVRDTDNVAVAQIRQSIVAEQCCTVRILNYRKDNISFWNLLHTAPIRNASGKLNVSLDVDKGIPDSKRSTIIKDLTSFLSPIQNRLFQFEAELKER